MADFKNEYIKGKSLEELIDDLGKPVATPSSVLWETIRAAIEVRIAERLIKPRFWGFYQQLLL